MCNFVFTVILKCRICLSMGIFAEFFSYPTQTYKSKISQFKLVQLKMKKSQILVLLALLLLHNACSIRVSHPDQSFNHFLISHPAKHHKFNLHLEDEGATDNTEATPSPPTDSPATSDSTPQSEVPKNAEESQPHVPQITAQQEIKKSENQEPLPQDTQNNSPSDDFKFYDADSDGFITLEEIKSKIDSLQKDITEEQKNEFDQSFAQLDKNKDSKLSLKEYLGKIKKSKKAKPETSAPAPASDTPASDAAPAHAMVLAHRRHLQQKSFLKSILNQNIFKSYNQNWGQVSANAFKVNQTKTSRDIIQNLYHSESKITSKISSSTLTTQISLELSPPLSAGPAVNKQAAQAQKKPGEDTKSAAGFKIGVNTTNLQSTEIKNYLLHVYSVNMHNLVIPSDQFLKYFPNIGSVNEGSVQRFFKKYGFWYPTECIFGANIYIEETKQLNEKSIGAVASVNIGDFVPAAKVVDPKIGVSITTASKQQFKSSSSVVKGAKMSDRQYILDNNMDALDHSKFVLVKIRNLAPISNLLPDDIQNKIENTQYFKINVAVPKMSVLSQLRTTVSQENSQVFGQNRGSMSFNYQFQNQFITNIVGYWDKRSWFHRERLYRTEWTFQGIRQEGGLSSSTRVIQIGSGHKGRRTTNRQGYANIDYNSQYVEYIELAVDNEAGTVGYIGVKTSGKGIQKIGRQDLTDEPKSKIAIGGLLAGISGRAGQRLDQISFVKRVVGKQMQARISQYIFGR